MADTLQDAVINIGADITKVIAAFQEIDKWIRNIQNQASKVNLTGLGGATAGIKANTQAAQANTSALKQQATALGEVGAAYSMVGHASTAAAKQQAAAAGQIKGQITSSIAALQNFAKVQHQIAQSGTAFFQSAQAQIARGIIPQREIAQLKQYVADLKEFKRLAADPGLRLGGLPVDNPIGRLSRKDVAGPGAGGALFVGEAGKAAQQFRDQAIEQQRLIRATTDASLRGFAAMRGGALKFGDVLRTTLAAANRDFSPILRQFGVFGNTIDNVNAKTGKFSNEVRGLLKLPNQGNLFQRIFGNFKESLELTTSLLVRYKAAQVVIDKASVALREFGHAAADVQDQLAQIRAITGETEGAINILGVELRKFAAGSIIPLNEATKGLQIFAQAGYSSSDALRAMSGLVALSVGGVTTLEEAAKLMTSTLQTFQLGAENADRIANVLVATANKSKTSVEELNVAFNYAGSTAANAGLSIEDLNAILGVLSNNGIRASTSGTAVRQVLSSLIEPATKARAVFARLGIDLQDIDPRANDIVDVFNRLRLAGFGTAEAFEAFDKRAGSAIALLIRQAGNIDSMRDSITGTNAAFEAMEIRQASLSAQTDILFNKFREFAIQMTQQTIPILTKFVGVLNSLFDTLNSSPLLRAGISGGVLAGFARLSGLSALTAGAFTAGLPAIRNFFSTFTAGVRNLRDTAQFADGMKNLSGTVGILRAELELAKRSNDALAISTTAANLRVATFTKTVLQLGRAVVTGNFSEFVSIIAGLITPTGAATAALFALGGAIYYYLEAERAAEEARAERIEGLRSEAEAAKKLIENYQDAQAVLKELTPGTVEYTNALHQLQLASANLLERYPDLAENIDRSTGTLAVSAAELYDRVVIKPLEDRLDKLRGDIESQLSKIGVQRGRGALPQEAITQLIARTDAGKEAAQTEHLIELLHEERKSLGDIKKIREEITNLAQYNNPLVAQEQLNKYLERTKKLVLDIFNLGANTQKQKDDFANLLNVPGALSSADKILEAAEKAYGEQIPDTIKTALTEISHFVAQLQAAGKDGIQAGITAADAFSSRLAKVVEDNQNNIKKLDEQIIEAQVKLEAKTRGLTPEQAAKETVERLGQAKLADLANEMGRYVDGYLQTLEEAQQQFDAGAINTTIGIAKEKLKTATQNTAPEILAAVEASLAAGLQGEGGLRLAQIIAGALRLSFELAQGMSIEGDKAATLASTNNLLNGGGSKTKEAKGEYEQTLREIEAERLKSTNRVVEAERKITEGEIAKVEETYKDSAERKYKIDTIYLKEKKRLNDAEIEQIKTAGELQEAADAARMKALQARYDFLMKLADIQVEEARRGRSGQSISRTEREAELLRIEAELEENAQSQIAAKNQLLVLDREIAERAAQRLRDGEQEKTVADQRLDILREEKAIELDALAQTNGLIYRQRDLVRNVGEVSINIGSTIQTAISDAFEGIIEGTAKWKDIAKSFGTSIFKSITGALAQSLVEKLGFDKAFVLNMQGLGNQTQGILGGAFSSVFGGATSLVGQFVSFAASAIGGIGGSIGSILKLIPGVGSALNTGPLIGQAAGGLLGSGGISSFIGGVLPNFGAFSGASSADILGGVKGFLGAPESLGIGLIPAINTLGNYRTASPFAKIFSALSAARSVIGLVGRIPAVGGLLAKIPGFSFLAPYLGLGQSINAVGSIGSAANPGQLLNILNTPGFVPAESFANPNFVGPDSALSPTVGGADGAANVTQALGPLLNLLSLLYTGYNAYQQVGAANQLGLGQKGPTTALKSLAIAAPLIGAAAGSVVPGIGTALGAAIGQLVSSTVQGAVGKGLSGIGKDASGKGLTQNQLNNAVLDDTLLNIVFGGQFAFREGSDSALKGFVDDTIGRIPILGDLVTGVMEDISTSLANAFTGTFIPDIDVYFAGLFRDLAQEATGLSFNRQAGDAREAIGKTGKERYNRLFGTNKEGRTEAQEALSGDVRTVAQIMATIIGAGGGNLKRLQEYIHVLKNGFAATRLESQGIEESLFQMVRHVTDDRFFRALKYLGTTFKDFDISSQKRFRDFIARSYQPVLIGSDASQTAIDILRTGSTTAGKNALKASRESVRAGLDGFLSASDFEEAFGELGKKIGDTLAKKINDQFTKLITSRSGLGGTFGRLFQDVTKGLREAFKKGLDAEEASRLNIKLIRDIQTAAAVITDLRGTLQYMSELFQQYQQMLEEAFLTDEQRQSQRVDLITGLLDSIGEVFTKMLGLILDGAKAESRLIQKRADLQNLGEEDQPIATAAVTALRAGVLEGFDFLSANLATMTQEQQLQALSTFEGSVDDFVSLATRQITEQFREAIDLAKQAKSLLENVQRTILSTRLADPTATAQDRLGAIQKEIAKQKEIMLTGEPEEQLKAAQRLNELFPQLLDIAGKELDQSGPEFAGVRSSVEIGLNQLETFLDSNAAKLEPLEEQQTAALQTIADFADDFYDFVQDRNSILYTTMESQTQIMIDEIRALILGNKGGSLYDAITEASLSQLEGWQTALEDILKAAGVTFPENNEGLPGIDPGRVPINNDTGNIRDRIANNLSTAYGVSPRAIRELSFPTDVVLDTLKSAFDLVSPDLTTEQQVAFNYLKAWLTDAASLGLPPELDFFRLSDLISYIQEEFAKGVVEPLFGDGDADRLYRKVFKNFLEILGDNEALGRIAELATGGLVDRRMIATIGEAGPEAVVPLNAAGTSRFLNLMRTALAGSQANFAGILGQLPGGGGNEFHINIAIGEGAIQVQGIDSNDAALRQLPNAVVARIEQEIKRGRLNKVVKDVTRRSA